jgi:hypothetical protein
VSGRPPVVDGQLFNESLEHNPDRGKEFMIFGSRIFGQICIGGKDQADVLSWKIGQMISQTIVFKCRECILFNRIILNTRHHFIG